MQKVDLVLLKIGKNIKAVREAKNVSLEQLSEKTKIKKQYLERIEKGLAKGITTSKFLLLQKFLMFHRIYWLLMFKIKKILA